jgi:hypothetical protein
LNAITQKLILNLQELRDNNGIFVRNISGNL